MISWNRCGDVRRLAENARRDRSHREAVERHIARTDRYAGNIGMGRRSEKFQTAGGACAMGGAAVGLGGRWFLLPAIAATVGTHAATDIGGEGGGSGGAFVAADGVCVPGVERDLDRWAVAGLL